MTTTVQNQTNEIVKLKKDLLDERVKSNTATKEMEKLRKFVKERDEKLKENYKEISELRLQVSELVALLESANDSNISEIQRLEKIIASQSDKISSLEKKNKFISRIK